MLTKRSPEGFNAKAHCSQGDAKLILPPSPFAKNIFIPFFGKVCSISVVPDSLEGRFATVTNVEMGMRWTRPHCRTGNANADGEGVWSWHPWAGAKLRG